MEDLGWEILDAPARGWWVGPALEDDGDQGLNKSCDGLTDTDVDGLLEDENILVLCVN